jgi:hypothetical protein
VSSDCTTSKIIFKDEALNRIKLSEPTLADIEAIVVKRRKNLNND